MAGGRGWAWRVGAGARRRRAGGWRRPVPARGRRKGGGGGAGGGGGGGGQGGGARAPAAGARGGGRARCPRGGGAARHFAADHSESSWRAAAKTRKTPLSRRATARDRESGEKTALLPAEREGSRRRLAAKREGDRSPPAR